MKLRDREDAARAVSSSDSKDRTPYAVVTPEGTSEYLPKRRALLLLVQRRRSAGVPAVAMAGTMRPARLLSVDGVLDGEALTTAFVARYSRAETTSTAGSWTNRSTTTAGPGCSPSSGASGRSTSWTR